MAVKRRDWLAGGMALLLAACGRPSVEVALLEEEEDPDLEKPRGERFSMFVPTPERVALRMLELARVGPEDLVLDLGSGDGRIPLLAAQRFGARGWGVDINLELVDQSNAEARRLGLAERVRFEHGDATLVNPRQASVVTMYLFPALINRIRPVLLKQLRPGARIATYEYTLADWPPDETLQTYVPERYLGFGGDASIRLWIVPANFSGTWNGRIGGTVDLPIELRVQQRYQRITGSVRANGKSRELTTTQVRGDEIEFVFDIDRIPHSLRARLADGRLGGQARVGRGEAILDAAWSATRAGAPSRIDIAP